MNVSVNIDFIYDGINYVDAIKEASSIGYKKFEIIFMKDKSVDQLTKLKKQLDIDYQIMMTDFIPWIDGRRENEFVAAAEKRINEAKILGCNKIVFFTDDIVKGMTHAEQLEKIKNCAKRMLPMFEKENMLLLLEPINNKIDHKECSLWDFDEAVRIVKEVDSPNFKMLYDIYHMQIMQGDVTRTIIDNINIIEHIHCAGNPGRHEIYNGELNYINIIKDVLAAGYKGSVGIEYFPVEKPSEGLKKIRDLL